MDRAYGRAAVLGAGLALTVVLPSCLAEPFGDCKIKKSPGLAAVETSEGPMSFNRVDPYFDWTRQDCFRDPCVTLYSGYKCTLSVCGDGSEPGGSRVEIDSAHLQARGDCEDFPVAISGKYEHEDLSGSYMEFLGEVQPIDDERVCMVGDVRVHLEGRMVLDDRKAPSSSVTSFTFGATEFEVSGGVPGYTFPDDCLWDD